jgi:hypothetical protein
VAGDKKLYGVDIAEALGAPETRRPVSLVASWYERGETPRKPKRALNEMVHWETW